jgi:hypothetical protein
MIHSHGRTIAKVQRPDLCALSGKFPIERSGLAELVLGNAASGRKSSREKVVRVLSLDHTA